MRLADLPVPVDREAVAHFADERGIRALALFGSVLRHDFSAASDVDILVEYLPDRHPGLMLFEQQADLSRLFGRAVDLHTAASLSPYFRERVVAEAVPIYGGA